MKNIKSYSILFFINTLVFFSCETVEKNDLILPSVFSNHMVLQQQSQVSVWGKSSVNQEVIIQGSWGSNAITTTDSKGNWETSIETPSFGGPFELSVKSNNQNIIFSDVMIGEVWLASGQSNMEWNINQSESGRGIENQNEYLSANYPDVRMYNLPQDLSGKYLMMLNG
jgi:sialate O-acetylesterase